MTLNLRMHSCGLSSANCLVEVYIWAMFVENLSRGIWFKERTLHIYKNPSDIRPSMVAWTFSRHSSGMGSADMIGWPDRLVDQLTAATKWFQPCWTNFVTDHICNTCVTNWITFVTGNTCYKCEYLKNWLTFVIEDVFDWHYSISSYHKYISPEVYSTS